MEKLPALVRGFFHEPHVRYPADYCLVLFDRLSNWWTMICINRIYCLRDIYFAQICASVSRRRENW
ncbi:MAG: hypothetical protein ACC642_07150, partial [Pseudomonadales bacterium]